MDLHEEILREHSKQQAQLIASWIGGHRERFASLVEFVLSDDETISRRAAWVLSHCLDEKPALAEPHLEQLVAALLLEGTHHAVRRSVTKSLQTLPLPDDLQGLIFDTCMAILSDLNEPVAARAHSMTVLTRICEVHPSLADEVAMVIQDGMPQGSAAYISRGRRTLKQLEKLSGKSGHHSST